jgi:threonine synthase
MTAEGVARYSYLSHLECARCGLVYDATVYNGLCTRCKSPLLARYDLEALAADVNRDALLERPWELWRYHELLPSSSPADQLSLGEVVTPLLEVERYGRSIGLEHVYVKDESATPTSTFKARGAAVGVSRIKELGIERIAMPTNGNAGAAWASYAARGQISSLIVMPEDAPAITRAECLNAGARLHLVDGVISDAGAIVADAAARDGWVDVGTLKEPYRIEGKKTMGFEIVEQLGWELPDVIAYPTGGGVGLIGIHKAITEMQALGWVTGTMPRFVAVQSTGCAPIVSAFDAGRPESAFWPDSQTKAFGINVPKALGDFIVLDVLYQTHGCAVAVSDDDLLAELRAVGAAEGLFMCPEGAATAVAVRRLATEGWIDRSERVVILNTGAGIKYPGLLDVDLPVMSRDDRLVPAGPADSSATP